MNTRNWSSKSGRGDKIKNKIYIEIFKTKKMFRNIIKNQKDKRKILGKLPNRIVSFNGNNAEICKMKNVC